MLWKKRRAICHQGTIRLHSKNLFNFYPDDNCIFLFFFLVCLDNECFLQSGNFKTFTLIFIERKPFYLQIFSYYFANTFSIDQWYKSMSFYKLYWIKNSLKKKIIAEWNKCMSLFTTFLMNCNSIKIVLTLLIFIKTSYFNQVTDMNIELVYYYNIQFKIEYM